MLTYPESHNCAQCVPAETSAGLDHSKLTSSTRTSHRVWTEHGG